MRARTSSLLLIAAAFLTPAVGADVVSYGPAAAWVKPVAVPKHDGSMPDAPARALLRSYQLRFTADSTEWHFESFVRLQTPAGLQSLGNLVLPWKPDSDVLTVHKCELIRGDRTIDLLGDGKKFEVLRRENNLEYAALDGVLSAVLQPAGMEVGDILHLAFSVKRAPQLIGAPEIILADFSDGPIARVELRAQWDKAVPVRWRASQDMKGVKETRVGKGVELSWEADNLEPLNQPSNVPSRFLRYPLVEFTTYGAWTDVSRKLAPLYEKAATLPADSPLKAEARAIADASADPAARLEATLKLVQDRVRYVFLGMGDGNINPAHADLTWQRRFGDCKGKSALLIALLRELGIQSEAVAVSTVGGDAIQDRLPMVGAFNHVIVRARAGGRTYWLDGAGSGGWRRADMSTPNYRWGLPLTARGETLVSMQAEAAAEPLVESSTSIDARAGIHTDAPFKAEIRIRGATGAALHAQLSQMAAAGREQALRGYWAQQFGFVEIKSVSSEFLESTGTILMRMDGTAAMDWSGDSYATDGLRIGAPYEYERKDKINADAPFLLNHPFHVLNRQRIELPEAGTFTTKGGDYDLTLAGTQYMRRSKIENRVFTGETWSRSLVPEVPAAEARAAQKQLNAMWQDRLDILSKGYKITDADLAALRTRKYTDRRNLNWRGNIFLARGDYDAALADFDAAVKADSTSARALALRGLTYYWKNDHDRARTDFDAALALDAEDEVALRGLGASLRARGNCAEAIVKFTESLRFDPESLFALTHRAYCYAQQENEAAALVDAAKVLKLSPAELDMYDLRAGILASQGRKEDALAELQAMIAANPTSMRAQWWAARNYSLLGMYPEAVKAMDLVIADKASASNYSQRAAFRDPADITGRIADLDAALAAEPGDIHATMMRAAMLAEAGNHAAARDAYTALLKSAGEIREKRWLWTERGIQLMRLGDATAARRDFAAALADKPDSDVYNNHCWALAVARVELAAALAACDKALAIAPKNPAFLDSRGFVLLQLGRYDEAIAAYDAALALRPKAAASLYGRGIGKKRRCSCADGEEDIAAGARLSPMISRTFALAGLE
jgi:tetratricopeptide (TPR) repeat protein/transglutaminase-like putative cysteine protease